MPSGAKPNPPRKISLSPGSNSDGSAAADSDLGPRGTPEWIAGAVRDLIHRGALNGGDRLPSERELCEQVGVARLTLRAGLKILRDEGYIESRRGSGGGTYVTELAAPYRRWVKRVRAHPRWLEDLTELRVAVESHTAQLAARRRSTEDLGAIEETLRRLEDPISFNDFRAADAAFHSRVAAAAANPVLASAVGESRGKIFVPGNADLVSDEAIVATHEEHRLIYEAISGEDDDGAAAAMESHLRSTHDYVRRALQLPEQSG